MTSFFDKFLKKKASAGTYAQHDSETEEGADPGISLEFVVGFPVIFNSLKDPTSGKELPATEMAEKFLLSTSRPKNVKGEHPPKPYVIGKELIMKLEMKADEDEDFVRCTVKIGSFMKQDISKLTLAFENVPPYFISKDENEPPVIKNLGPGAVKRYHLMFKIFKENVEPGRFLLGKDISISATLAIRDRMLTHIVNITNHTSSTITDLLVLPFVPEGHQPGTKWKLLDVLYPSETKTLTFNLPEEDTEENLTRRKEAVMEEINYLEERLEESRRHLKELEEKLKK